MPHGRFVVVQQCIATANDAAQPILSVDEHIVDIPEQVADRHRRELRGNEFKRQRQAAALAEPRGHVRCEPFAYLQIAAAVVHPIDQDPYLCIREQCGGLVARRCLERLDRDDAFALEPQRNSARLVTTSVSSGQFASSALAKDATPSTTISQPSSTSRTRPSGAKCSARTAVASSVPSATPN